MYDDGSDEEVADVDSDLGLIGIEPSGGCEASEDRFCETDYLQYSRQAELNPFSWSESLYLYLNQ